MKVQPGSTELTEMNGGEQAAAAEPEQVVNGVEVAQKHRSEQIIRPADIALGETGLDEKIKDLFNDEEKAPLVNGWRTGASTDNYYRENLGSLRLVVQNARAQLCSNADGPLRLERDAAGSFAGTFKAETRGRFPVRTGIYGSPEAMKYVVNVPNGHYLPVFLNGKPYLLDSGTHVIKEAGMLTLPGDDLSGLQVNDRVVDIRNKFTTKNRESIEHATSRVLLIPRGMTAMCRIDNQVYILDGRSEPHEIRFEFSYSLEGGQFFPAAKPFMQAQDTLRLFIPKDEVAAVIIDGVPSFIEGKGAEEIVRGEKQAQLIENRDSPFYKKLSHLIQNGPIYRLYIPQGHLAAVNLDGVPSLMASSGKAEYLGGDHDQVIVYKNTQKMPFYPMTHPVIQCGNFLRLFLRKNEIATVRINGQPALIEGEGKVVEFFKPKEQVQLMRKDQRTDFHKKMDPVIQINNLTRLRVPIGCIATLFVDGVPTLHRGDGQPKEFGRDGKLVEFSAKAIKEPFFSITDPVIQIGSLIKLNIPKGQFATIVEDGVGRIIEGDGAEVLIGDEDKRAQFIPKSKESAFYDTSDPIIQVGQKVRLCLPPGVIMPATVNEEQCFLSSKDNEKFSGEEDILFQVRRQASSKSILLPMDEPVITCGSLMRVFVEPGFVGVIQNSEGYAKVSRRDEDTQNAFIIDRSTETWVGSVHERQQTLSMPSEKKKDDHLKRGGVYAKNSDYDIYKCIGGVPVGVRFNVVFSVKDPLLMVEKVGLDSLHARIEDIIESDMGTVIGHINFSDIRGTPESLVSMEQQPDGETRNWHNEVKDKLTDDFKGIGVNLISIQISDCEILDPKILEDQAKNADKALNQKLELDQTEVKIQLASAGERQTQVLVDIKQAGELARLLEKQKADQEREAALQQAVQERQTALQQADLGRQMEALKIQAQMAELRAQIAGKNAQAAQLNAKAELAPLEARATLLSENPKFMQHLEAMAQIEAAKEVQAGMTVTPNSLAPRDLFQLTMAAVASGNPSTLAGAMLQPSMFRQQSGLGVQQRRATEESAPALDS